MNNKEKIELSTTTKCNQNKYLKDLKNRKTTLDYIINKLCREKEELENKINKIELLDRVRVWI